LAETQEFRLLVCGSRDFGDDRFVSVTLDRIHAQRRITRLIEGGQAGADRLAREWAQLRGVPCETYEADWKQFGISAGPRRNARMLREGRPDGCLAFPGEDGTWDMIEKCLNAQVTVRPAAHPLWDEFARKHNEAQRQKASAGKSPSSDSETTNHTTGPVGTKVLQKELSYDPA
jgi:hypothetical protein